MFHVKHSPETPVRGEMAGAGVQTVASPGPFEPIVRPGPRSFRCWRLTFAGSRQNVVLHPIVAVEQWPSYFGVWGRAAGWPISVARSGERWGVRVYHPTKVKPPRSDKVSSAPEVSRAAGKLSQPAREDGPVGLTPKSPNRRRPHLGALHRRISATVPGTSLDSIRQRATHRRPHVSVLNLAA